MSAPRQQAIVDIGSNSIRLVVFGGAPRAPVVLYNEKLMAGLGRGVVASGRLDQGAVRVALAGLARFAELIRAMDLDSLDVVATAAVREAENGEEFLAAVRDLGLPARILDGAGEARAAGFGVIAGLPSANGTVADLGGGSLELVRVADGEVGESASFPLGAMRVASLRAKGPAKLKRAVAEAVRGLAWREQAIGKPLYLVGGSWRTLARLHMHLAGFPLPVIANYGFSASEVKPMRRSLAATSAAALNAVPGVKSSRLPQIGDAGALLAELSEALKPDRCVVSAFGLREGLLFARLDAEERARDPLIEGARFMAAAQQQVPGYSDALCAWLDQLFGEEAHDLTRLRNAVCLLRGTGWSSNPEFRALGGEEMALHGNWTGITAAERATMAMALFVGMGGSGDAPPPILAELADQERLSRAKAWGLAMRLAQRIAGGAPALLGATRMAREEGRLVVTLPPGHAALLDATVERRAARLATALGLSGATVLA
ncbi:Ppx/GppA family phosphatase [Novosphingobium sp. Gsoil 351]|uniref:Ppx/GppA family phosphatase n=1 Tax=Novosphingobium sp. Gsoil 351 TaxID=2675225 RepID=UPI0012B47FD7|nr:Ppx/GppA family phosphatase [Novosphingobium sp. Gsoil 351]QGN55944.1 Ppx/GppA family phosphatase [Novosphingobium sp. Gsoil 351]